MKEYKAHEYDRTELRVGMEVMIPKPSENLHKYRTWTKSKIVRIPTTTKAVLDNGGEIRLTKSYTGLYRYEEWMDEESKLARMDHEAVASLNEMQKINFEKLVASVSEEDLPAFCEHVAAIAEHVRKYKSSMKSLY